MNAAVSPASAPLTRVRVASAAEAEKIREYVAGWVALEPAALRLHRTKRWKTNRERMRQMRAMLAEQSQECVREWLTWQLLRAFRAIHDFWLVEHPTKDAVKTTGDFWASVVRTVAATQALRLRWASSLVRAICFQSQPDIDRALQQAALPIASHVRARLAAITPPSVESIDHSSRESLLSFILLNGVKLDAGQLTGLVWCVLPPDEHERTKELAGFKELLSDARLTQSRNAFNGLAAIVTRNGAVLDEQIVHTGGMILAIDPPPNEPPLQWRDARLVHWLHATSTRQLWRTLLERQGNPPLLDEAERCALLAAPLCWRLWLDDRWESAALGAPGVEPQRTVLRELVTMPGRFLRLPNPTPAHADVRRALRPIADLLEGSPLATERAALLAALDDATTPDDERLHLLSVYCAQRWRAGVSPKIHTRLSERMRAFLLDDIAPQAGDILRGCAVEVGRTLPTNFDLEFERLLAAEEAAQEQLDAELRQHADAWRERLPARGAFALDGVAAGESAAAAEEPLVLRYVSNLGEPRPREQRIATTRTGLEQALEEFCAREGIRVNIPFSSIAHAVQRYVWDTPAEQKRVWPERETYGPLELHKIKRGGMRLLVRESDDGLWLHLLQRRDWFLGER